MVRAQKPLGSRDPGTGGGERHRLDGHVMDVPAVLEFANSS